MNWKLFPFLLTTLLHLAGLVKVANASSTECRLNETSTAVTTACNDDESKILGSVLSSLRSAMRKIDAIEKKLDQKKNKLRPKNCLEIHQNGGTTSPDSLQNAIHLIFPFGPQGRGVSVSCDFETAGGGWTVLQRRRSGPANQVFSLEWPEYKEFNLDWLEYEEGFGNVRKNYWIGLKIMHALTSSNRPQELRIDLADWQGSEPFAKYSSFAVANSTDSYRLSVNGYTGTAGNSLIEQDGAKFSTKDRDNDIWSVHCAQRHSSGWWFGHRQIQSNCGGAALNGRYHPNSSTYGSFGILWYHWRNTHAYSMKSTEMKIRDANFI